MGRKKKKTVKPWCWYCNRDFDDEKILIQHQKAKHFKCHVCHRKLFTGPGLSIHCMQVHKEKVDTIPNALPNRTDVDIEIYGMEGIPDEDIKEHEKQKLGIDEEPETKRSKDEGTSNQFPPPGFNPMFPMGMPPMPPPGMMPPPRFPMPGMPMGPPGMHPMMPRGPPPPFMNSGPPPPGLFPSAPPQGVPTSSPGGNNGSGQVTISAPPKPTFPAYSTGGGTGVVPKVPKPTSSAPGMKTVLMHPEEDISLEERRANQSRYRHFLTLVPPMAPPPNIAPPASTHQSVVSFSKPPVRNPMPHQRPPGGYPPGPPMRPPPMQGAGWGGPPMGMHGGYQGGRY